MKKIYSKQNLLISLLSLYVKLYFKQQSRECDRCGLTSIIPSAFYL